MVDEIGETTVRRGGVSVLAHRQSKMAGHIAPGALQGVFALAEQLHERLPGKLGQ
jgi:hypothetical protein